MRLTENYSEMQFVDELIQKIGLTDTTVNIRLRTLKAIFNQLRKGELIEINPYEYVNLLRQDIDFNKLLDCEFRNCFLHRH